MSGTLIINYIYKLKEIWLLCYSIFPKIAFCGKIYTNQFLIHSLSTAHSPFGVTPFSDDVWSKYECLILTEVLVELLILPQLVAMVTGSSKILLTVEDKRTLPHTSTSTVRWFAFSAPLAAPSPCQTWPLRKIIEAMRNAEVPMQTDFPKRFCSVLWRPRITLWKPLTCSYKKEINHSQV